MNILLINQGHTDNLGDKAIAKTMSDILYKISGAKVTVMPFIPNEKSVEMKALKNEKSEAVEYRRISLLRKVVRSIKRKINGIGKNYDDQITSYKKNIMELIDNGITYNLAIIGGGELIKGNKHPFFYSLQAWSEILEEKGIPAALIGVSSDSKFNCYEINRIQKVLSKYVTIVVRDQKTKEIFSNDLKINCECIPDVVFVHRYLNEKNTMYTKKENKIAFCIYAFQELSNRKIYRDSLDKYYEFWFELIEKYRDEKVPVLSYTTYSDYCESCRFKKWLKDKKNYDIELEEINTMDEFIYYVNQYKQIVSGRMHSMILALQYGTTITPIIIKNKLSVFEKEWGEYTFNYDIDGKKIYDEYKNLILKLISD